MKIYIHIIASIVLLLTVFACDTNEINLFEDKDAFFAFEGTSASVFENDESDIEIPVYISHSSPLGNLEIDVDIEGIENPAIEGEDFIITSGKTLEFNGEYYQSITLGLIDNDLKDQTKSFNLVLTSTNIDAEIGMADGKNSTFLVTINDDEHPLAALFGDWDLNETTIAPEEFNYTVNIKAHPNYDNRVLLHGLWEVDQDLELEFDVETNEVKILANQIYTDVEVGVVLDFTIWGWQWGNEEQSSVKLFPEVTGTYDIETGEIEFPEGYLLRCSGPEGSSYIGGIWTWTIQDYCKMVKK